MRHHSKGRRSSRAVAPVTASEWGDPTGTAVLDGPEREEEIPLCPLCIEPLDETEVRFKPCPCGYQVCLFCYERIKLELNGLCPSCRTPYGSPQEATPRQIPLPSTSSHSSQGTAQEVSRESPAQKQGEALRPPELASKTGIHAAVLDGLEPSGWSDERRELAHKESRDTSEASPMEEASTSAAVPLHHNAASSSVSNGNYRSNAPPKQPPSKTSQVIWGQSASSGAQPTSHAAESSDSRQGLAEDVHRVRQNSSEAAVQSSAGFSWGPPVVNTASVRQASSSQEVGSTGWGGETLGAASMVKTGQSAPSQAVLTSSSFPSLASGVPKPQTSGRKVVKRARTPASRSGGVGSSGGSTPQNSRPGTPLEENGVLDGDRKEAFESKHGRSLSEDVLRGFEGFAHLNGLRPTSSGGVQSSRLFSGGYGLTRTFSSRASSVASEDSGGSLGGGSPARGVNFAKSVYGAALNAGGGQGGNGKQYSEGWAPEALAKARAIIAAARLTQVVPPPATAPSQAPIPQHNDYTPPADVAAPPLFPTPLEDGMSEVGGALAKQLSGLAVSDISDDFSRTRRGTFVGSEFGDAGKAGSRFLCQGGSLSRSSSRQGSMERFTEASVLSLVRECESGAETSGEILPDNPWQAPQLFRTVGGPVKSSNPAGFDANPGFSGVWNGPFGAGPAFGASSKSGSAFPGSDYSSFLGGGAPSANSAVPAAIQEAFKRPEPPVNHSLDLENPFRKPDAPFSFGSTKPPSGLANNSSPISPLANLSNYPNSAFFSQPPQNHPGPFGSPPFATPGFSTSPSSFKSAHSFFEQEFPSSRIPPPTFDPSFAPPVFPPSGITASLSSEPPILPSPPLFSPPLDPFLPNHQFAANPAPSLALNFEDPNPRGGARPSTNRRSGSRFFKNVKDDNSLHSEGILGNGPPSILGVPEPNSPSILRKGGPNVGGPLGSPRSPRTPKASVTPPTVNISAAQAAAAAAQTGLQLNSSHVGAVHSEASKSPNPKSPRALDYFATHNAQARRNLLGEGPKQTLQGRGAPNGLGGSGVNRA